MNKKRLTVVIGAIAVGVLLSFGLFVYPSLLSPRGHADNLNFVDNVTIKVFNPDGTVAQVWQGHNVLQGGAINGIVGCITGASTSPASYGSCSSWISGITFTLAARTPAYTLPGQTRPSRARPERLAILHQAVRIVLDGLPRPSSANSPSLPRIALLLAQSITLKLLTAAAHILTTSILALQLRKATVSP